VIVSRDQERARVSPPVVAEWFELCDAFHAFAGALGGDLVATMRALELFGCSADLVRGVAAAVATAAVSGAWAIGPADIAAVAGRGDELHELAAGRVPAGADSHVRAVAAFLRAAAS